MRRLVVAAALLALGGALALPMRVFAHALLQTSDPASGSTVDKAPAVVTITFGEEPDPLLSSIGVVDTSGQSFTAGPTQAVPTGPTELKVPLKPLPRGVYTVTWKTVSRVDGHFATGAYAFGVGESPAGALTSAAAVGQPPPSALAIAGRWSLYAGLVVLLGAAMVVALVVSRASPSLLALLLLGWLVGSLGTVLVTQSQLDTDNVAWRDVFSTSLGHTLTWRIVPLGAAAGLVVIALRARASLQRWAAGLAGVAAAGAMFADVSASHAAAESPVALNDIFQWMHIAAVGVWIGGLAALLVAIRGAASEIKGQAVRRFSMAAGICLVVVALTGIARAVIAVGAWDRLTSTAFGQLVLIKLGLVVLLTVLGGINRFRNVPAAARVLRGIRRVGSTEVVVGAAAILVAAALVNVAPPVSAYSGAGPVATPPLVVNGSDAGTTVRVRLEITPGTAGFNRFAATVTDYDTGAPVQADAVSLRLSIPSRPDVGGSTLGLKRESDGVYAATGSNLSLQGTWRVTVLVQRSARGVEVSLQVTTRTLPQKVDVTRFNGTTLYTIHLSGGGTLQVYLDPNKPGADTFHATFFDSSGNERPISDVAISMTPSGGKTVTLSPQRLTAGHFAADAAVGKGATRFSITATAQTGERLSAQLDITPGF